jgi:parallel beta-helix repeat protein
MPSGRHRILVSIILFALPASARAATWYVNDTSTIGDSFTAAIGDDANNGQSAATPKRTLGAVIPLLLPGDTVYIDSGIFTPSDTVRIETSSISIIGKDSASTIIDFADSSVTGARGIVARRCSSVLVTGIQVRRAFWGVRFHDVANSTISSIATNLTGQDGQWGAGVDLTACTSVRVAQSTCASFYYAGISVGDALSIVLETNVVFGASWDFGFNINFAFFSRLSGNWTNTCYFFNSSDTNVITGNRSQGSDWGFYLVWSHDNVLERNEVIGPGDYAFYHVTAYQNTLKSNVAYNMRDTAFFFISCDRDTFLQNQVDSCAGGFYFSWFRPSVFEKNNILRTIESMASDTTLTIDARRNWFGTTDSAAIRSALGDTGARYIVYTPFRLGIVDTVPGADSVAPRAPDSVSALALGSTSLRIMWAAVGASEQPEAALGLAGYRIYRSPAADTSLWVLRGATLLATSFDDSGLSPNTAYFYRVTAVDNHAPFENQSFYSDSIAGATTYPDTSGPNVWYVNDTATAGDSFTSAVGSNAQSGLRATEPKRSVSAVMPFLTAGDTVYIDAGFFYENDTVTIVQNGVFLIGKDSLATIIAFNDTSVAGAKAIFAADRSQLTVRDFTVQSGQNGIWWINVDSSAIRGVKAASHGGNGIWLDTGPSSGCDANSISGNLLSANTFNGLYVDGGSNNTVANNAASGGDLGIYLEDASMNNTLTANVCQGNATAGVAYNLARNNTAISNSFSGNATIGIYLLGASNNTFLSNTVSNNAVVGVYLTDDGGGNGSSGNAFHQNTIDSNGNWAVDIDVIGAADSSYDTFQRNIIGSSPYASGVDSAVRNATQNVFDFRRNFWKRGGVGTTDSSVILSLIGSVGADSVLYSPFLLGQVDTAPGADTVAPEAPAGMAIDSPYAQIRISWAAVGSNEDGHAGSPGVVKYLVHRARRSDTSVWGVPIGETTSTVFADTRVLSDTDYFYRITAQDGAGNQSFYSVVVTSRTYRATGDFSGDSTVSLSDMLLLWARFGDPTAYDPLFDIGRNGPDGVIDYEDLVELGRRYGP